MNRRQLLKAIPALAAATQIRGQSASKCRLRAGLVAYSFRKQLEEKTMTYESLIRYVSDLGLDGLDTTVYWFPDTSNQFLASLRRTAYKNAVNLYSVAVRARLCQPTPELQTAEVENVKKWVDVAEKVGATHVRVFGGAVPKGATEARVHVIEKDLSDNGFEVGVGRSRQHHSVAQCQHSFSGPRERTSQDLCPVAVFGYNFRETPAASNHLHSGDAGHPVICCIAIPMLQLACGSRRLPHSRRRSSGSRRRRYSDGIVQSDGVEAFRPGFDSVVASPVAM